MAYIANTAFEVKVTNAVFDETANITGVFSTGSAGDVCSAGFLCVRGDRLENEGYTGIDNVNAYTMTAAASTDNQGIYACNPFGVNEVTEPSTGAVRKVGANTLGIALPKDVRGTFTRIDFDPGDRIYRFGIGNLSAAISTNTFFTINNGLLVPAAAAPTDNGAVYFTLVGSGTFTQGAYAAFTYYDLQARRVFSAVAASE